MSSFQHRGKYTHFIHSSWRRDMMIVAKFYIDAKSRQVKSATQSENVGVLRRGSGRLPWNKEKPSFKLVVMCGFGKTLYS
jgi:hypothetical protein